MLLMAYVGLACCRPEIAPDPDAPGRDVEPAQPREVPVPPAAAPPEARPSPARCGLPASLLSRGWPRRLSPTASKLDEMRDAQTISLAVLPDTQYYAACRLPHLKRQSEWIARNAAERNIIAVLQLGDLTDHNTPEQWEFVRDSLRPVTERLPALLATGNHDHGDGGRANRRWTLFQRYFSPAGAPTAKVTSATLEPGNWENAYYRLPLPRVTLGVLVLEWSPRTSTVEWARAIVSKHPEDRIILVTHAYLYHDGTRYDWATKRDAQEWNPHAYGTATHVQDTAHRVLHQASSEDAQDGERLWRELVSRHAGFFLTLNGHVLGDGVARSSSPGEHGNVVHEMLANYQMLEEGGSGYLRLLELLPSGDRLRVETYSPSLDVRATGDDHRFELTITPPLWNASSPQKATFAPNAG